MRILRSLPFMGLLLVGGICSAQMNPDYVLDIGDASGSLGGTAEVTNTIDMSTATEPLAGWSWGQCDDDLVTILEIVAGADTLMVNDGDGPDFNAPAIVDGGWTIGVVVNLLGQDNLPIGGPYELHHATYQLEMVGDSVISYCDTLGSPVVETVLVDTATPSNTIIPTQNSGTITIMDNGGGCEFTFAAGSALDVAPATPVVIPITLDNTCDVEAFSFGIAHDGGVATLDSITEGSVVLEVNGGLGPDFFGPNTDPANGPGGTLGVVVTIGDVPDVIPVGSGQEVAVFNYTAGGGGMTPLSFRDGELGDPAVPIVVTMDSQSMPASTTDGVISVMGVMGVEFVRGDVNNDSFVDVSDGIRLARALLQMGPDPITCDDAGDTNDDGELDGLADTIYLLNDLFIGGPDVPFPNFFTDGCGVDPTPDALECDDYQGTCP